MVRWANDGGVLQAKATQMLVYDVEMLVNDGEMLVNDGEMSIWSYTHFTIILTSILLASSLKYTIIVHLTIIEKLHRLPGDGERRRPRMRVE